MRVTKVTVHQEKAEENTEEDHQLYFGSFAETAFNTTWFV
jgi:hypothetical protein